jgi:small subunit ribosomal protein S4e
MCLPLEIVIRDDLKLARTRREVSSILSQGKVKVDGRTRIERKFPVGMMDVIELPDANMSYRVLPLERQGLSLVRIPKDEAKFKLCKVLGKNVAPKGVIQYNTHDGRSIAVTKGEGEPADYAPNDTLRVSIPTQRVLNHIKFEKGNYALVIAGRNQGKSGKIVDIQGGNATRPAMVKIEDPTGSKFDTMVEYTFAVGTDKPAIKLEAS